MTKYFPGNEKTRHLNQKHQSLNITNEVDQIYFDQPLSL